MKGPFIRTDEFWEWIWEHVIHY